MGKDLLLENPTGKVLKNEGKGKTCAFIKKLLFHPSLPRYGRNCPCKSGHYYYSQGKSGQAKGEKEHIKKGLGRPEGGSHSNPLGAAMTT